MEIVIASSSILGITLLVWMIGKVLPFQICPICAGVSGTWAWMLLLSFLGYEIDLMIPAILLGGSVVGIAYQLEKKLSASKSPLLWKVLFIPTGFIGAYSLISQWWAVFFAALALLGMVSAVFLIAPRTSAAKSAKVQELEKKMKNCC
ncbi:MAG: hypothetical protein HYS60_02805 [Candidatus Wildermuthbacteria bacterium]|nr:hypothetical protein [Candidatus Wildermuthbacteria bacterium]